MNARVPSFDPAADLAAAYSAQPYRTVPLPAPLSTLPPLSPLPARSALSRAKLFAADPALTSAAPGPRTLAVLP